MSSLEVFGGMVAKIKWSVITIVTIILSGTIIASEETKVSKKKIIGKAGEEVLTAEEADFIRKYLLPNTDKDTIAYIWKVDKVLTDLAKKENFEKDPLVQSAMKFAYREILAALFIKTKQDQARISEQEIKDYYEKHKSEYRDYPYVTAKLLAVKKRETMGKIKKVIDESKTPGQKFDELAEKYKEQTKELLKLDNINIKNVYAKELIEKVSGRTAYKIASTPKKEWGKVIGPLWIPNGWLMCKVLEVKEGKILPFEKVRDKIYKKLIGKKKAKIRREWLDKAKRIAGIDKKEDKATPKKTSGTTKPSRTR